MNHSKKTKGEELTSLEVDKKTQEKMLKDPKIRKSVQKVFAAIGGMQDDIDKALGEKNQD